MLHIVLLILKILGILLLVILSLVFFLLLTLIWKPLAYRLEASCGGDVGSICGRCEFHWLFRLVKGEILYEDGNLRWDVRAAWKHFTEGSGSTPAKKDGERGGRGKHVGEGKGGEQEEQAGEEKHGEQEEQAGEGKYGEQEKRGEPEKHMGQSCEKERQQKRGEKSEKALGEARGNAGKTENTARLKTYTEKLKYTFYRICDNIKTLIRKKDRLKAFLTDEVHKSAFFRTLKELKRLFRFLKPRHFEAGAEFGFEDPAVTGYVLAGLSMIYPMIGEYTMLTPDFEHKVLKGKVSADGKFRIVYVLIPAWNMFMDKNVRTTYRHIRKFKL